MIDFAKIEVEELTMVLGPMGTPLCAVPFGLVIPVGAQSISITGLGKTSALIGGEVPSLKIPVAITSLDVSGMSFGPCTSERDLVLNGVILRQLKGDGIFIANALLPKVLVEQWSQAARAAKAAEVARGKQLTLDI